MKSSEIKASEIKENNNKLNKIPDAKIQTGNISGVNILYEDNDIIVVEKPYGIASQTERGSSQDMVSLLLNYFHQTDLNNAKKVKLSEKNKKPSKVPYVGVVHRLDKNVGGVMVYGKNKLSASKLSGQISDRNTTKKYYAIIHNGDNLPPEGILTDILIRDGKTNTSRVAGENEKNHPEAKKAELKYKLVGQAETECKSDKGMKKIKLYLADITLITGRHHQIRVQFSHRGCPLAGDRKYGAEENRNINFKNIGLYCYSMTFKHPVTGKQMTFEKKPDNAMFNIF